MERPPRSHNQVPSPEHPTLPSAIRNAEKVVDGSLTFGEPEYLALQEAIRRNTVSPEDRDRVEGLLATIGPAQIVNCLTRLKLAARTGRRPEAIEWLKRTTVAAEFYGEHDPANSEIYRSAAMAALIAIAA